IDSSNPFGPDASAFGSGEITHLGRSVFFGELDLFYRFDSSFDAHGRFEFRASNGDELYATFVGKGSFDGYSFTSFGGTLTIVGDSTRGKSSVSYCWNLWKCAPYSRSRLARPLRSGRRHTTRAPA